VFLKQQRNFHHCHLFIVRKQPHTQSDYHHHHHYQGSVVRTSVFGWRTFLDLWL